MKYYRVKPEYDNTYRFKNIYNKGLSMDGLLIKNELYTPTEAKKYIGLISCCELVEIPKNKTYFFFGARFAEV